MSGLLFDPGLQPERTELAWRRTILSIAVGAIVALRILPSTLGRWSIGAGVTGLALTAALWLLARRRSSLTKRALLRCDRPLPGAALLFILTVVVTAGAALGLAYVTLT
jgi:hypothetical protein